MGRSTFHRAIPLEGSVPDDSGLIYLNSHIRYADIHDGSSHTLLVGEISSTEPKLGWMSGTRATLRNTGDIDSIAKRRAQLASDQDSTEAQRGPFDVGSFGSFHAGGVVLFTLADGAVRTVSNEIDRQLYRDLGHRADGHLMKEERYR